MSDLGLLRVVQLKGRVRTADVATPLGVDDATAISLLEELTSRGLLTPVGAAHKLSEDGVGHLTSLLDAEREHVDRVALEQAYDEFCEVNGALKTIVTAWQMRDETTPNDHSDAAYDASVLAQLADLHARVHPLIARIGKTAPRLGRYADRLQHAADQIAAGDVTWVARPIMDSYHTVWFELHEDLIQLCGRTRVDEAMAGRAH